jgi:hypothetical protein
MCWVLKGRYFPNGDILSVRCPRSASRVWKTIICGREVLKKGRIRRIDNENDTLIWENQWLTGVPGLKPLVWNEDTELKMVAEVTDPATCKWDEEIVIETFCPLDADDVLRNGGGGT